MKFRQRFTSEPLTLQLAPMIDVIMFLLTFFLLTWNLSRYELDLEVKVPTARHGKEPKRTPGEVIVNVRKDGTITLNRRQYTPKELEPILKELVQNYPDQAMILRADEDTNYKYVVAVLDVCRAADLWNIAFASGHPEAAASSNAPPS